MSAPASGPDDTALAVAARLAALEDSRRLVAEGGVDLGILLDKRTYRGGVREDRTLSPLLDRTPEGLRSALTQLHPTRVPEFDRHLARAATQARQAGDLAPLEDFVRVWATFAAGADGGRAGC